MARTDYEMTHNHFYAIISPVPTDAQKRAALNAFNTYLTSQSVGFTLDLPNLGWWENRAGTQVTISVPHKTKLRLAHARRIRDWIEAHGFMVIATYNDADPAQKDTLNALLARPEWTGPLP